MRRRGLFWKLFPTYLVIALASVGLVGLYALSEFRDLCSDQVGRDLLVRADLISHQLTDSAILHPSSGELQRTIKRVAGLSRTRVTVIALDGNVLADSERDPRKMDDHSDRPEFRQALAKGAGTSRRMSPTLGKMMVYAAVPIKVRGKTAAVVRTSLCAGEIDARSTLADSRVLVGTVFIAVLAGIAGVIAARRISEPIARMEEAAARYGKGDFLTRVPVPDTEEMASLAETLNQMASQLGAQIKTITQQSQEQQAIMSGMKEGVVAVGAGDQVILLNPAAEELLEVSFDSVKSKAIQEAIRNPGLHRLIEECATSGAPASCEIVLRGREERIVQAMGAPLLDPDGRKAGVVVVLNDVTQTRKLENVRKDFVANVSHELKTPITSIKGFVEALQAGALKDPAKSQEFLEIIGRQADRLDAIIDDLLTLAKIEQGADARDIELVESPICEVLDAARTNCLTKSAETGIEIIVECDEGLIGMINSQLLEQAVTNLLDNAIKFSPPRTSVAVKGEVADNEIAIRVIDRGQGIEPQHIPRLFERFYRVDTARSRKLGGTGLGLAIVKHVVQAHGGRVEVESTPGKGSTFSIILPGSEPGDSSRGNDCTKSP